MTDAALPVQAGPSGLLGRLTGLGRLAVAILLALHPLGAVLVLGWLMRLMRAESALAARRVRAEPGARRAPLPSWLGLSALWETVRDGTAALLTLAAGTLPFTLLWLFSWWGGWENSFNKGYEQAWVGPTVALVGVLVALPLLARLPMALAHQAAEGRMSAFFARRRVSELIAVSGWRYVWLATLTVLAALPIFALTSLPTFIEGWRPGFAGRTEAEVERFVASYRLAATAYLVVALQTLRRMAARLHGRATGRLDSDRARLGPGGVLRAVLLWTLSFGLVAQVFVAQFVNHQWSGWLLLPLHGLPFFAPLSPLP